MLADDNAAARDDHNIIRLKDLPHGDHPAGLLRRFDREDPLPPPMADAVFICLAPFAESLLGRHQDCRPGPPQGHRTDDPVFLRQFDRPDTPRGASHGPGLLLVKPDRQPVVRPDHHVL